LACWIEARIAGPITIATKAKPSMKSNIGGKLLAGSHG
jgi:hypothetical protein